MSFDPDWEANSELLVAVRKNAPGKELLRLLKHQIGEKTHILNDLIDPNNVGSVCKLMGELKQLHELWGLLTADFVFEEEPDD